MDPLFERRELTRKVHIYSKSLQKNIQSSILAQLRMNIEGRCSPEGYIQPNSITILNYSLGRVNLLKGGVDYDVQFQADVCLPHTGQTLKATTVLRSKIGIHAETPPIKVLIPRDLHLGNEEFNQIDVNQEIEFEVVGAQFKQQDKDIIVVGKLKTMIAPAPLMPLLSAEVPKETEIPVIKSEAGEEKVVTVQPVAEEKKRTRKLKRGGDTPVNESFKEGMA